MNIPVLNETFLDTEEEDEAWHKGIWTGLKTGAGAYNPKTLYQRAMFSQYPNTRKGFLEWYKDEGHYHDVPMIGAYLLTNAATLLGLYVFKLVASGDTSLQMLLHLLRVMTG